MHQTDDHQYRLENAIGELDEHTDPQLLNRYVFYNQTSGWDFNRLRRIRNELRFTTQ